MPDSASTTAPRRPWRILVLIIVLVIILLFSFALWSEEEDLESLPVEQVEGEPVLEDGP